jgi:hypothetical protein
MKTISLLSIVAHHHYPDQYGTMMLFTVANLQIDELAKINYLCEMIIYMSFNDTKILSRKITKRSA